MQGIMRAAPDSARISKASWPSGLAEFRRSAGQVEQRDLVALRDGEIVGLVAIDGEDLGGGFAHLRWFIVEDGLQGVGVGRRLLTAAMTFVDERGVCGNPSVDLCRSERGAASL